MTKIAQAIAYVTWQRHRAYHPTKRMRRMANGDYWAARADILDEVLTRLKAIEKGKR
jgi:hypothetical protein